MEFVNLYMQVIVILAEMSVYSNNLYCKIPFSPFFSPLFGIQVLASIIRIPILFVTSKLRLSFICAVTNTYGTEDFCLNHFYFKYRQLLIDL